MKRRGKPIRPSDPLVHPRRRALVQLITNEPGQSFRGLVKASGIPAGTCRHHLNQLIKHALVWETRIAGCKAILHYPGREPVSLSERMRVVRRHLDPGLRALIDAARQERLNQKGLIRLFPDVARGTIQHRLKRLVEYGFLREQPSGRHLFYEVVSFP